MPKTSTEVKKKLCLSTRDSSEILIAMLLISLTAWNKILTWDEAVEQSFEETKEGSQLRQP